MDDGVITKMGDTWIASRFRWGRNRICVRNIGLIWVLNLIPCSSSGFLDISSRLHVNMNLKFKNEPNI